jgi:hypothetical protein
MYFQLDRLAVDDLVSQKLIKITHQANQVFIGTAPPPILLSDAGCFPAETVPDRINTDRTLPWNLFSRALNPA